MASAVASTSSAVNILNPAAAQNLGLSREQASVYRRDFRLPHDTTL
jgi:hypothetical protein